MIHAFPLYRFLISIRRIDEKITISDSTCGLGFCRFVGAFVRDTIWIKIRPVEDLPAWVGCNTNNVNRNEDFADTLLRDLKANWVDSDSEPLTYSTTNSALINSKLGHSLINDTLRIWSRPDIAGGWAVTLIAKDPSGDSSGMQFFVNIASINDAPYFLHKGDTLIYEEGKTSNYDILTRDVDNVVYPNYTTFKPAWMSTHLKADTLQLYGAPTQGDIGTISPMALVDDDCKGGSDTNTVYIKVVAQGTVSALISEKFIVDQTGVHFATNRNASVDLFDLHGHRIESLKFRNQKFASWNSNLASGQYFLRVDRVIYPLSIR